jgi:hypothetical protein
VFAISMAGVAAPASAVNSPLASVVSANPADFTPQVMNGSVQGIIQIGNKIVAVGVPILTRDDDYDAADGLDRLPVLHV